MDNMKRLLAILLCLVICFSLVPVSASAEEGTVEAASEGTITAETDETAAIPEIEKQLTSTETERSDPEEKDYLLTLGRTDETRSENELEAGTYSGIYQQTEARAVLELVNEFRTGEEAWFWNSDDTTKTEYNVEGGTYLGELTYDYALEQIAMQRAVEIVVSFEHTRPNGESCFTCTCDGVQSYGENIACGTARYMTADFVMDGWKETDEPYAGQGHRRNMLRNGYTAIGVACFEYDGMRYWVQEFGYSVSTVEESDPCNNTAEFTLDASGIVTVSIIEDEGLYIDEDGNCTVSSMEDLKELVAIASNNPEKSYCARTGPNTIVITESITIPENVSISFDSSFSGLIVDSKDENDRDITLVNEGYIFWMKELKIYGTIINYGQMEADFMDGYYIALLSGNGTVENYGTISVNGAGTLNRIEDKGGMIYLTEPLISSMSMFFETIQLAEENDRLRVTAVMKEPMNITEDLTLPSNVFEIRCSYSRSGYGLIVGPDATVTADCPWVVSCSADIQGTFRSNSMLTMKNDVTISGTLEVNYALDLSSSHNFSCLTVEEEGRLINNGYTDAFFTQYEYISEKWILCGQRFTDLKGLLINKGTFEAGTVREYGSIINNGDLSVYEECTVGSLENNGTATFMDDTTFTDSVTDSGVIYVDLIDDEDYLHFGSGCSYTVNWGGPETLGCIHLQVANEVRSDISMAVTGLDFENEYTANRAVSDLSYSYVGYGGETIYGNYSWIFWIRPTVTPESPYFAPADPPYEPTSDELAEWRKDYDTDAPTFGTTFSSCYGLAALLHDYGSSGLGMWHYNGTDDLKILFNIRIPENIYVYVLNGITTTIPEEVTMIVDGGHLVVSNLTVNGCLYLENGGTAYGQVSVTNDGLIILDESECWVGTEENSYSGNGSIRIYGTTTLDEEKLDGIDPDYFRDEYNLLNACHVLTPLNVTEEKLNVAFKHNCEFAANIALHYLVPKADVEGCEDIALEIEMEKYEEGVAEPAIESRTITKWTDYTLNGEEYCHFVFPGIFAAEMGNKITAKVSGAKSGETVYSQADEYSVKEYAYNRLEKTTSATYRTLLVDMLNYGSAAQMHFGKNAANLVNADLTATQASWGTQGELVTTNNESTVPLDGATAEINGKNLMFGSSVYLLYRMAFAEGQDMNNVKIVFTYTNLKGEVLQQTVKASKFGTSGNYYTADCTNIIPSAMRCVVSATIYDGTTPISDTLNYSIETYVHNRLSASGSATYKALITEMLRYGISAENHFG